MKIGFVTTDWSSNVDSDGFPTLGGSAYYRVGLPHDILKEHGIDTFLGAHLGRDKKTGELGIANWREDIERGFDVIVLHRWMEEDAADHIRAARACGQVVVNDVDDHFDGLSPQNQAFITTHPKYNKQANRNHYKRALGASSALIVSTPFFQDWARTNLNDPPTWLLRNTIDLRLWSRKCYLSGPPAVGWVGMTSHRSGDLQTIAGVIEPFLLANGGRFHHSGHWDTLPHAASLLAIENTKLITTVSPPCRIDQVPNLYHGFNIGIVPLASIPFNYAKSCIKGLEYAAAGIPFIASSTPEYEWLREEHGIGFTANRRKDWTILLKRLADPEVREAVAKTQTERIEALSSTATYETLVQTHRALARLAS